MNLVKFQDVIVPDDNIFNRFFKGKYCYALNWKFFIPIEMISQQDFIKYSQNEQDLWLDYDSTDSTDSYEIADSVDMSDFPLEFIGSNYLCEYGDFVIGEEQHVIIKPEPNCEIFKLYFDDEEVTGPIITYIVEGEETDECSGDIPLQSIVTHTIDACVIEKNELHVPILDWETYSVYIDIDKTTEINSVDKYIYLNKFVADYDITEDELRMFRTWLATSLLELTDSDMVTKTMLHYYKEEMHDSTLEVLDFLRTFKPSIGINLGTTPGCGCGNNAASASTLSLNGAICNPSFEYKAGMHGFMINTFSKIEYWAQFDEFLLEIIKYLNGILKLNFPLWGLIRETTFAECSALSERELAQTTGVKLINDLIKSFQYIHDGEITEHKNFISKTLFTWADRYYEIMRW